MMLGIDVSSCSLHSALCSQEAVAPKWRKQVPNSVAGIRELLAATPADIPMVVEPTGRYSLLLVEQARAAGRRVLLAPPRESHVYLRTFNPRGKTDALDGRGLAWYGLTHPLREYPVKSVIVDTLDQTLSARKGLAKALANLTLQAQSLPRAADAITPSIQHLRQRIKELDKQIAAQTKEHPEFAVARKLQKVHGVGAVTAAAVTSRLAAKRFAHPDQFVAYVGLDVTLNDSGKIKGRGRLSKMGDAELRRLLFICAKANLRCKDSPFKDQYQRERAKGLATTAALCAVARKIACVLWSMHRHNADYDAQRVSHAKNSNRDRQISTLFFTELLTPNHRIC